MIRTIISHDEDAGLARIRFEHAGVTVEDEFTLIHVVPGTRYIFDAMGIAFEVEHQLAAIDFLTASIERQIDDGAIRNPPAPSAPAEPETENPVEPEPED